MVGPGDAFLEYNVHTTTFHSLIWRDGVSFGSSVPGIGSGVAQPVTAYGRIYDSQSPATGSYSDTITVTVSF